MTTYLGKSCSFCLPRVPFVNCRQFMYLVISLLVLRAGYGICLYQFLIIAYLFTFRNGTFLGTCMVNPDQTHLPQTKFKFNINNITLSYFSYSCNRGKLYIFAGNELSTWFSSYIVLYLMLSFVFVLLSRFMSLTQCGIRCSA